MHKYLKRTAAAVLVAVMLLSSVAFASDMPLRRAFEGAGADVSWDGARGEITIRYNDREAVNEIIFTPGSVMAYRNGEQFELSAPIVIGADNRALISEEDFEALSADIPAGMFANTKATAFTTAETLIETLDLAGMTIAIVHSDSGYTWLQGFGYADIAAGRLVDEMTLFDIGSTSKPFAAISVLQLVEQGLIDLDEPIVTYLPDFSVQPHPVHGGNYRNITARMLLAHSSGLPVDFFGGMMSIGHYNADLMNTFLARMAASHMDNIELARIAYANNGIGLAGILAAHVAGHEDFYHGYISMVSENILETIGMRTTTFLPSANANVARPYNTASLPQADSVLVTNNPAAGGMWSNAYEMALFMHTILEGGGEILTEASVNEMFRVQSEFDMTLSAGFAPGLGTLRMTRPDGLSTMGHDGNSVHHHTFMQFCFDSGIGVFASTNTMSGAGAANALGHAVISAAIYETTGSLDINEPLPDGEPIELSVEELEAFIGYFTNMGWVSINEDGNLQMDEIPGMPAPVEFIPYSDGSFGALGTRFWIEELAGTMVVFQGDHRTSIVAERLDSLWAADDNFDRWVGTFEYYSQFQNSFPVIRAVALGVDENGYAYIKLLTNLAGGASMSMLIGAIDNYTYHVLGTGRNLGTVITISEDGSWIETAGTRFVRVID